MDMDVHITQARDDVGAFEVNPFKFRARPGARNFNGLYQAVGNENLPVRHNLAGLYIYDVDVIESQRG